MAIKKRASGPRLRVAKKKKVWPPKTESRLGEILEEAEVKYESAKAKKGGSLSPKEFHDFLRKCFLSSGVDPDKGKGVDWFQHAITHFASKGGRARKKKP